MKGLILVIVAIILIEILFVVVYPSMSRGQDKVKVFDSEGRILTSQETTTPETQGRYEYLGR